MAELVFRDLELGSFRGKVREDFLEVFKPEHLSSFAAELADSSTRVLSEGRHRVVVKDFTVSGVKRSVVVKAFGRQGRWKDQLDRRRGTKAERSFRAAKFLTEKGVGTPRPIGFFDRWDGRRLVESYYLSEYLVGLTSFKDELITIYREHPECERLVSLLDHVANSVRSMHDAGFWHRDLGNQNMELLPSKEGAWGEVQFIDLNRGRIREALSLRERAQDFSRFNIPSFFLDVFVVIYWRGDVPKRFWTQMRHLRMRFEWWESSRRWRHPFRRQRRGPGLYYPKREDIWIWDSQSAQASVMMNRRERKNHYPAGRHRKVIAAVLRSGLNVWREYRRILPEAFSRPVKLRGRIGVALEAADLDFSKQLDFLKELGVVSVLLRFCHHEGREQWKQTVIDATALAESGYDIMLAFVQDRQAVLQPDSWKEMLSYVLEKLADKVTMVEVCHAVNRMKWGVHSPGEQRKLLEPIKELQEKHPEIKFSGPACIDFEYHYVLAALAETPKGLHYSALSHHLYVDRRGAPENFQGKFGTVEKCALLKAIAEHSACCEDRVIISEVNWPIKGTGIYSPVDATYMIPGKIESRLTVSEETYGHYMLRYLVLTLCSGFVDQVYWWRLVAHGFGLVDERSLEGWRARPGYEMLVVFLKLLGNATFVEKLSMEKGVFAFRFQAEEKEIIMVWCHDKTYSGPWPFTVGRVFDVYGKESSLNEVGESPVYGIS